MLKDWKKEEARLFLGVPNKYNYVWMRRGGTLLTLTRGEDKLYHIRLKTGRYYDLGKFKTKSQALRFASAYRRTH